MKAKILSLALACFAVSGMAQADFHGHGGFGHGGFGHGGFGHAQGGPGYVAGFHGHYDVVEHHGDHYYYSDGRWYRPYGGRYVYFAPPFGVRIGYLPLGFTTLVVAGATYYMLNDVYYVRDGSDYVVVPPPTSAVAPAAAPVSEEIYAYPNKGQDQDTQARDRYECHQWAVQQSRYDPSAPPPAPTVIHEQTADTSGEHAAAGSIIGAAIGAIVAPRHAAFGGAVVGGITGAAIGAASAPPPVNRDVVVATPDDPQGRSNYHRAMAACLEARNYTVR